MTGAPWKRGYRIRSLVPGLPGVLLFFTSGPLPGACARLMPALQKVLSKSCLLLPSAPDMSNTMRAAEDRIQTLQLSPRPHAHPGTPRPSGTRGRGTKVQRKHLILHIARHIALSRVRCPTCECGSLSSTLTPAHAPPALPVYLNVVFASGRTLPMRRQGSATPPPCAARA